VCERERERKKVCVRERERERGKEREKVGEREREKEEKTLRGEREREREEKTLRALPIVAAASQSAGLSFSLSAAATARSGYKPKTSRGSNMAGGHFEKRPIALSKSILEKRVRAYARYTARIWGGFD